MIHRITLIFVRFSVVPYTALFQYWIMNILFFVKSTDRSAQIRMLQFFKEKYFIFNKFQLNFLFYCTQNEESCFKICRLLVINRALRVKFWKKYQTSADVSKYTHQCTHCLKYYSETL